jgi:hypothetical protein
VRHVLLPTSNVRFERVLGLRICNPAHARRPHPEAVQSGAHYATAGRRFVLWVLSAAVASGALFVSTDGTTQHAISAQPTSVTPSAAHYDLPSIFVRPPGDPHSHPNSPSGHSKKGDGNGHSAASGSGGGHSR